MTTLSASTKVQPFRTRPAAIIAMIHVAVAFVLPAIVSDSAFVAIVGMLGGVLCGVALIVWWAFFSRAPRSERWGAFVLMVVALLVTSRLIHESIAGGMMGMMFPFFSIPMLGLIFAGWVMVSRRFTTSLRRASMIATILLASGMWMLVRTDGITGGGASELAWRWSPTSEERLLAQRSDDPVAPPSSAAVTAPMPSPASAPAADSPSDPAARSADAARVVKADDAPPAMTQGADWAGFRGTGRDSIIHGLQLETNWSVTPPVQLWRRPVGPGWSSFAVQGDLAYTQEQRGDDEVVACYRLSTGEPVWRHRDAVRFWESNGGAGPRATPTLSNGRLFTFGATGIVNALNAANGAVVWSRNAAVDTDVPTPGWGFTSSPLVVDDLVIVAVSGALIAYDVATGNPRWTRASEGGSYSSPHRTIIDGVSQVILLSGAGAVSVAPSTGAVLWEHSWPGGAIVQPAVTADGNVVINSIASTGGVGTRRLTIGQGAGGWTVQERWTSNGLKPYFSDFVLHKGHAYGFDGSILASINLEDGKRNWKGGRYGSGQLMLIPEQDLLLVLAEDGSLALVSATTDQFREITRAPAIEGKTWNHPVLVGDVLLVRNGEEMGAFRLPVAARAR